MSLSNEINDEEIDIKLNSNIFMIFASIMPFNCAFVQNLSFSQLIMDSKKIDKLMFHTPKDKSYQCADVGKISLLSAMQWNYTKMAPEHVDNTTIKALHVRFDAFRNVVNGIKGEFRVI